MYVVLSLCGVFGSQLILAHATGRESVPGKNKNKTIESCLEKDMEHETRERKKASIVPICTSIDALFTDKIQIVASKQIMLKLC